MKVTMGASIGNIVLLFFQLRHEKRPKMPRGLHGQWQSETRWRYGGSAQRTHNVTMVVTPPISHVTLSRPQNMKVDLSEPGNDFNL